MGKPAVAVIEDDSDIAEIVRFALEREGCEVRIARDGGAGMTLVAGWEPDLVLLDVSMPRRDGWTVLKGLREAVATRQTPVVMMTANNRADDVSRAMAAGADDYLVKPFEIAALTAKVRRRLAVGRARADGAVRI